MFKRSFNKTRIAPTPSGYLHLGNAYSFLMTADIAKRTGAKLLLRIDDLDAPRVRREYTEDIFETLHFLEIEYDEGPRDNSDYEKEYSQQYRMALYENVLSDLAEKGLVYACECSRAQLEMKACDCASKRISLNEVDVAWRLRTDPSGKIIVHTYDRGIIETVLPAGMKNFIVRKKDGFPAYQLSSLADDVHFGIDLVVRGEDLWESTLAQLYLAGELGISSFLKTAFHHHALLRGEGGEKLSKSAGASSVRGLRTEGKSREDILKDYIEHGWRGRRG